MRDPEKERAERLLVDLTIAANRRFCERLRNDRSDFDDIPEAVVADMAPGLPREQAEHVAEFIRANASLLRVESDDSLEWHAGVGEFADILLERARIAEGTPEQKARLRDQALDWQGAAVRDGQCEIRFGDRKWSARRVMVSDVMDGAHNPASWDRMVGRNVPFEHVRRITGYLSALPRFNNAKKAEEHDRVKHGFKM